MKSHFPIAIAAIAAAGVMTLASVQSAKAQDNTDVYACQYIGPVTRSLLETVKDTCCA